MVKFLTQNDNYEQNKIFFSFRVVKFCFLNSALSRMFVLLSFNCYHLFQAISEQRSPPTSTCRTAPASSPPPPPGGIRTPDNDICQILGSPDTPHCTRTLGIEDNWHLSQDEESSNNSFVTNCKPHTKCSPYSSQDRPSLWWHREGRGQACHSGGAASLRHQTPPQDSGHDLEPEYLKCKSQALSM